MQRCRCVGRARSSRPPVGAYLALTVVAPGLAAGQARPVRRRRRWAGTGPHAAAPGVRDQRGRPLRRHVEFVAARQGHRVARRAAAGRQAGRGRPAGPPVHLPGPVHAACRRRWLRRRAASAGRALAAGAGSTSSSVPAAPTGSLGRGARARSRVGRGHDRRRQRRAGADGSPTRRRSWSAPARTWSTPAGRWPCSRGRRVAAAHRRARPSRRRGVDGLRHRGLHDVRAAGVGEDGRTRMVRSCIEGPVFGGDRSAWPTSAPCPPTRRRAGGAVGSESPP